jgi:hypothetical protein
MGTYIIKVGVRLQSKSYFQTLGESRQTASSVEPAISRAMRELKKELSGKRIAQYQVSVTKI